MYTLRVSDHMMIAHSFGDPFFGPAQNVHGATYVVHAKFKTEHLNEFNVVLDIGIALKLLQEVLSELNYQNLDHLIQFEGKLTTTEYLCAHIHSKLRDKVSSFFTGMLEIQLDESPVASASYEARI